MPQLDPPRSPRETLPTMYDLPSEDPEEPGLPDEYHALQPQLLSRTFASPRYSAQQVFAGSDLNLYYDVYHPLWHKRPDWFLVVGVSRLYEGTEMRSSYVTWQEGVNPFVVVELLSPGTEKEDLGETSSFGATVNGQESRQEGRPDNGRENFQPETTPPGKWQVYEHILRVPYYVVFSRYDDRLRFFQLVGGHYQEQLLDLDMPRLWIPELQVGLGLWSGDFQGIERCWLRWYDAEGNWISTDTEQERQRAEQERQRAEQERQRAEHAETQLRQVVFNLLQAGMSIAQVASITGLTAEQVQQMAHD